MTTLDYIEQKYRTATLTELCGRLHLPMHVLSKMIKKSTGFNFKELLQRKRLNKAVELMCETDLPVSDCKLCLNGTPVPLLRESVSSFV